MNYNIIKYPDGQLSVDLKMDFEDLQEVEIKERINSYEDVFKILSIVNAIRTYPSNRINLFIPCLFGQRSDRRFMEHNSFDLKIICDALNSAGFNKVRIFDPHSDVSLALVNNSIRVNSFDLVQEAFIQERKPILVAPDAGAYKKVFEYGKLLGTEVVAAVKHRQPKGDISLQFIGDVQDKRCLIVDDLLDGGATFISLAAQLRAQGASQVVLYISHGYFSKGYDDLLTSLDHIYCTNSVKEIDQVGITQFKVI